MNNFIHRTLGHFYCAEEGAPAATGSAPAAESATTGSLEIAATTANADLDAINATATKTVAELEADAAKTADPAAETPEAKLAREAAEKVKAETVPETYEAFKLPDGVELDPAVNTEFNTLAKELNLTQAQAQKLIDLQSKVALGQTTAQAEEAKQAFQKQSEDWVSEAKADPETGGAKFEATVATAMKAMAQFGTPELRQFLNDSGVGNHPQLIKLFHKIGTAISEDKVVIPGSDATSSEPVSPAQSMFGDVKFD